MKIFNEKCDKLESKMNAVNSFINQITTLYAHFKNSAPHTKVQTTNFNLVGCEMDAHLYGFISNNTDQNDINIDIISNETGSNITNNKRNERTVVKFLSSSVLAQPQIIKKPSLGRQKHYSYFPTTPGKTNSE